MKIAFITSAFKPELSGVTVSLYTRALALAEAGHVVRIFCPDYSIHKSFFPDYEDYLGFIHPNIEVIAYPSLPLKETIEGCIIVPFYKYSFNPGLKAFSPDIIHVDEPFRIAGLKIVNGYMKRPGIAYARKYGIPITCTWHTQYFKYAVYYLSERELKLYIPILEKWFAWIYNAYTLTLCHSHYLKDTLKKLGVNNGHFGNFHGVNLELFGNGAIKDSHKERGKNGLKILYAGRLEPEKELPLLFDAFEKVMVRYPDVQLLIAGGGSLAGELRERYRDKNRVLFKGLLKPAELAELYRKADIFVTPSTTETFGNTVIEASASGIPVVGPRAGGLIDTLKEGVNGLSFSPHNADDMAEKITRLIDDENLRGRLAVSAARMAKEYSNEKAAMNMLSCFESLINPNDG